MATYKYTAYYNNDGPSRADPLREVLSKEEVDERLQLFVQDVKACFEEMPATIEIEHNTVLLTTNLPRAVCDERVGGCLNSLGLSAKKSYESPRISRRPVGLS
ncbi:hypothetical protein [Limnohabitans sp. JirII-31]|uniref:hypothetical protein n=1 Tax=Limnohabitans sp. JirII-31 TaxID=1977908 RepID=UPI001E299874|nr:hypothetical protein [Limnohabitans sp. JirII-31]